eukprot:403373155
METSQREQSILFTPHKMGDVELPNRIVMAALTRTRCNPADGVPTDLHVEYYSARASSGFILTECSQIREDGCAFPGAAGIHSDEQVEGWKRVNDAIHQKGGRSYLQIWHGGRAVHPDHINGLETVSASAIAINGTVHTKNGRVQHAVPRELTIPEIKELVKTFRRGAENAKRAGFDGIQLHGAHGYLVDQFLKDSSNQRTDEYGGSIENKSRFCLEVLDELIEVFGAGRVGIKLSPVCDYNDQSDSDVFGLHDYLFEQFNKKNIAFVEVNEALSMDPATNPEKTERFWSKYEKKSIREIYKPKFNGTFITNYQLDFEKGTKIVNDGHADLVSYGILYVCNDNLVEKFKNGTPLNNLQHVKEPSKIFTHYFYNPASGATGYTDLSVYEPAQE